ncbi:NAD(P)H-dependent oxidoreductase [Gordonia sp. TBRC 11910]|uniref:NAD(P)H-dependent oxidoreductase n=1 Tax=Gordonia asplenii TaxID=2725283 RepID=A0A848KT11_9ACTN|nr:NAD(P)H-dependent oxidoreductase [Gordonia asplenii]NMO01826.1 NAD(P)H-dependent oxidoreductase [Gordonia asplenii]
MTKALALVCTLKPSPAPSSSDVLARQVLGALDRYGVAGDVIRVVDHDVAPGVERDMGGADEWPRIADAVEAADILLISTPTWLGHMSSVAQRVLERLNAELSQTDDANRPAMVGKVGMCAVVGNEDGAHKIIADVFQGLNDIGFTIGAQGSTYWNDEAMGGRDYADLDGTPTAVATATESAARNAAHLAKLLAGAGYPDYPSK